MLHKTKTFHKQRKDKPDTLAKADDLGEGKSVYMQEILDHLSYYQFSLNEHVH